MPPCDALSNFCGALRKQAVKAPPAARKQAQPAGIVKRKAAVAAAPKPAAKRKAAAAAGPKPAAPARRKAAAAGAYTRPVFGSI